LNKALLFTAKVDDGGGFAWMNTYNIGSPDMRQSVLAIDREQNILMNHKCTKDSVYYLYTYKFSQAGALLWKKKKPLGTFNELHTWVETDSSCNVYVASQTTGTNPYGTNKIYKYDKTGNDIWSKSIANMRVNDMKVNQHGNIFIAGDKFFTQKSFPAYRPYFRLLDNSGNLITEQHDQFIVDANPANIYNGRYNDVVYDEQADIICAVGQRAYEHYLSGTKNYYILNAFNTNIPRMPFENKTAHQMSLYPNPVESNLYFKSEIDFEKAQLEISDMQGRIVLKKELYSDTEMLDVSALTKGVYTAAFISEGYKAYFKLVKY
jgi:hypothetical protein